MKLTDIQSDWYCCCSVCCCRNFIFCFLVFRNILPTGAALMYSLDEMCMLSMRMFFNSLTYQANKLLEKVTVNLCCSCVCSWTLIVAYSSIIEKIILFSDSEFPLTVVQVTFSLPCFSCCCCCGDLSGLAPQFQ